MIKLVNIYVVTEQNTLEKNRTLNIICREIEIYMHDNTTDKGDDHIETKLEYGGLVNVATCSGVASARKTVPPRSLYVSREWNDDQVPTHGRSWKLDFGTS